MRVVIVEVIVVGVVVAVVIVGKGVLVVVLGEGLIALSRHVRPYAIAMNSGLMSMQSCLV